MTVSTKWQTLVQAILRKDVGAARSILQEVKNLDAIIPERKNRPSGERLLMLAAEQGLLPLVRLLISKQVDVNALNQFRQPALLYAIRANNPAIVAVLLRAGSNPNVKMADGDTLLSEAARAGVPIRIAHELLKAGADPRKSNHLGSTALHVAAFQNRLDVAKLLLQAGVNSNLRDRHGHGPISCAILRKHGKLAAFLIKTAADPQRQPEALGIAAAEGNLEIVRLLVDQGWDVASQAHQNRTPLWHAQKNRRKAVVSWLKTTMEA